MKIPCRKCGRPFRYRGKQRVCRKCRKKAIRVAKQRWKKDGQSSSKSVVDAAEGNLLKSLCVKSAVEVGEALGLTRDQVLTIERNAIRKLRPEIELLRNQLEGDQVLVRDPEPTESFNDFDLIEFQMSVGEWWALADHLSDVGKPAERDECVAQIGSFQRTIAGYLEGFAWS